MDVCEPEQALQKQSATGKTRLPLVPAENKNGIIRQVQTRDVRSRYRSPTPSSPTAPKRSPSPFASRTSSTSTPSAPKRAISVERKRPSRPSSPLSPRSPSTPVQDTNAEMLLASRKVAGNKLPEALWPSTMRSLSVSFQSDSYSLPITKREKPVSPRISSNIVHKQAEIPASRKPTPERKRSPLKGKNSADQSENFKPVDGLNPRLVDQHRWPSRAAGKVSTALNRSVDLADKAIKIPSLSRPGTGTPSLRRLSLDGASKPLIKTTSDFLMQISRDESGKAISGNCSVDDNSLQREKLGSPGSSSSSDRTQLLSAAAGALSTPTPVLRPLSLSVSRGLSPSRAKAVNTPTRVPSPARVRPASPTRQSQSSTSVLSFIADIKQVKKANQIEDVHQLRILYNRHLQWRYANALSEAALQSQKEDVEEMVCSVWMTIADLLDSIMEKRIELLQLRLKLKLFSVLNNQLSCLDEWATTERDYVNSLTWAIQDLQASAIRVPFTRGARGDIETVKAAICSAVDVMQAMGSSLCSVLPKVEGMNSLVTELADLSMQERAMIDECDSVLGSTAALQVEENSLRTQIIQRKGDWRDAETSIFGY